VLFVWGFDEITGDFSICCIVVVIVAVIGSNSLYLLHMEDGLKTTKRQVEKKE